MQAQSLTPWRAKNNQFEQAWKQSKPSHSPPEEPRRVKDKYHQWHWPWNAIRDISHPHTRDQSMVSPVNRIWVAYFLNRKLCQPCIINWDYNSPHPDPWKWHKTFPNYIFNLELSLRIDTVIVIEHISLYLFDCCNALTGSKLLWHSILYSPFAQLKTLMRQHHHSAPRPSPQ